jgi:hypothetical protein
MVLDNQQPPNNRYHTMAAVRTFTLPHYEAYPVQIALFKGVKNAEYLRSQLLAANSDFDYAFLDAAMVSIVHVYSLFTPHLQPHAHVVRRPFPSRNSTLRLCTPQTLYLTPSPLRLIPITFSLAQSALNLNLITLVRALPITSFTFCTPHLTLPVLYTAAGNLQSRCFAARHPPYPARYLSISWRCRVAMGLGTNRPFHTSALTLPEPQTE